MRKHCRPYGLAVFVMVLFLSVGALAARLAYADPTGQGGEAGGQEQQPDGGEEQPQDDDPDQQQDGDPDQQQDGGQGQQPDGWWETFNPLDWVGTITEKVTESVKQVITEEAVDATTAFVHAAFLPANVEMLTLAGLAADRAPPGQVRAVRRLWSQLWWASVAVLVVAALVQAIRVAVDRAPDTGRARWVEWLLYPLAGAFMGRSSLFVVDALVGGQNMLWQGALSDATPCALLYGYCDSGSAMAGVGMVAGLFTWVITMIPVLVLSLLLAVNWVYLALAAVAGPVYTALAAAGRTPEPMAGWLNAVVRSALVQSMVGVGLFVLVLFRSAGQEPGVAGAVVRGLDGAGMLRFAVVMMLDLAVVYWWLIPVFAATSDLVTLKGGQVLESAGRFTGLVGAILAGAGVVTANPTLIAAGQKTAMAGRAAGAAGAGARQAAEARRHAQQQGAAGGWMAHVAQGAGTRPDGGIQSAATRAIAGLPPVKPYRIEQHGPGLPPGRVRVTAAPGLATAAVGAMMGRGMNVVVESRDFRAGVHDSDRLWQVLAQVLAGDDGPVKKDGQQVRTDGLGAAEQAAVAAALGDAGVAHQVTPIGVAVAAADAAALRRAVARAVTGAREVGDQIRFALPRERAAGALAALARARVHVDSMGRPLRAIAQLKGKQGADADAARKTAEKALAAAEQNVLGERPGYYRHGARYVVVRPGHPVETLDEPPPGGVYLGEWSTKR